MAVVAEKRGGETMNFSAKMSLRSLILDMSFSSRLRVGARDVSMLLMAS